MEVFSHFEILDLKGNRVVEGHKVIINTNITNQSWNTLYYSHTGCPKQQGDPRVMGHKGYQKWTKDKIRMTFAKFRLLPF